MMNRKYNPAAVKPFIKDLRVDNPNVFMRTDVMVGFPHETEGDFLESAEFIGKVGFAKVHVFSKY